MADPLPQPATLPFAVVIPTRNAGRHVAAMRQAIVGQQVQPVEVLVIDSDSSDGTPQRCREAGWRVHPIALAAFDHGGTRNLGAALVHPRAEAVVFLTQDSIPARPDAFTELLAPLADDRVALSYGRQVPRPEAGAIERHARLFNYRPQAQVKRLPEARALGIKAVFCSNSFAAWRRAALHALGGFPSPVIMGEDQVFAARLLLAGWSIAYAAAAEAVHSHAYSPVQEFRRYFDTGVYHTAFPVIGEQFGGVGGEGMAFIRSELAYLARRAPHLLAVAPLHWGAKFLGYRAGRMAARLPHALCRSFAMHKAYFRQHGRQAVAPASAEAAD